MDDTEAASTKEASIKSPVLSVTRASPQRLSPDSSAAPIRPPTPESPSSEFMKFKKPGEPNPKPKPKPKPEPKPKPKLLEYSDPSTNSKLQSPAVASPSQLSDRRSLTNAMPQSPKHGVSSPTTLSDKEQKTAKLLISTSDHPEDYGVRLEFDNNDITDGTDKNKMNGNTQGKMYDIDPRYLIPPDKIPCGPEYPDSPPKNIPKQETTKSTKLTTNIDKISCMSKALTNEANALRVSIKNLSEDIARTKLELCSCSEDVNFPYHLFLIEMIINKIYMKCECFDIDYNNLVISAEFLGKPPIVLYDSSYGKIENFSKLNVGKSTLFAMTYDKICNIQEFEIILLLTKQPPCSTCVTRIAETHMDFTSEFIHLREELCKKWMEEQPSDNILCTTSSPLSKNMYYLSCCDGENRDSIGVIEVTVRMSFLGKEITTAFSASPKPQGTSYLLKDDHGMTMYSCHKVEMDDQGKILLDEGVMTKKPTAYPVDRQKRSESPQSQMSNALSRRSYECPSVPCYEHERAQKYDEIYTKMNVNELKIRVPKSSRVERIGKYDKIQELCSCESTAYNTGEQIQFELPRDTTGQDNTYTSNLTYSVQGQQSDKKDRRTINVTPTNCPIPVNMAKELHPLKDVFILKIGKKLETKEKKTDLEIEFITPKAPSGDKCLESNNIGQQCSDNDNTEKLKKKKKSKKDAKGKKGKKGKKK